MMRFMCGEEGHFSDHDDMIEIEAEDAAAAAEAFIQYVDGRDSEWFARPDDAHVIVVQRGDKVWKFGASFDYVKSWRVRKLPRVEAVEQ